MLLSAVHCLMCPCGTVLCPGRFTMQRVDLHCFCNKEHCAQGLPVSITYSFLQWSCENAEGLTATS